MESQYASSDVLRKEILEQSQSEAEGIAEQAEKERSRLLTQAKKDAEAEKQNILKEAREQADAIRKKVLSTVHLDVKKQNLKLREKTVSRIVSEVRSRLDEFRKSPEYKDVLKVWSIEAVSAIQGEEIRLQAAEPEKAILKSLLGEITDRISKNNNRRVSLKIDETPLKEGGVIAMSSDGRMRFDNSFTALLRRKEDEMRLTIMKEVLS